MDDILNDPLWPHFQPLWADLQNKQADRIFIAGGYGLLLKQAWVWQTEVSIVIPLNRWRDANPRVTNDVDLVISVEIIAGTSSNQSILVALSKNGFLVTEKLLGKRWQFTKCIGENRSVLVELHAPHPGQPRADIRVEEIRVKHHPPLGDAGIHGRTNPEAIGCELQPSRFELGGQAISIVNPVTLCVMKLTALRDRWEASQDLSKTQRDREFSQLQATKHAQDVCRIVAMVTVDERNSASRIVAALKHEAPFEIAAKIVDTHFRDERNPAARSARNSWEQEDVLQIDKILDSWFK